MSSSIRSGFQMESYKVDKIDFSTTQDIETLVLKTSDFDVNYTFGFRDTLRFKNIADKIAYVTGLKISVSIVSKSEDKKEFAKGDFIINGLFYGIGTLSEEQELQLAKYQAPTILFPYARAVISQTLYNAGFSIPVMPLLNVAEMAKKSNVKVIDMDVSQ